MNHTVIGIWKANKFLQSLDSLIATINLTYSIVVNKGKNVSTKYLFRFIPSPFGQ